MNRVVDSRAREGYCQDSGDEVQIAYELEQRVPMDPDYYT